MIKRLFALVQSAVLVHFGVSPSAQTTANRRNNNPIFSPEVHPDRTVTFRIRASDAREVVVHGEWGKEAVKLKRDEEGNWSGTSPILPPEIYGYSFAVDKIRMADLGNPNLKPMRSPITSIVEIPGDPPLLHEWKDVPHGAVAIHQYYSRDLKAWRRVHIYTPPGYATSGRDYSVLYLFHGSGDNDATWSTLGRANVILDNLFAEKQVRPMIVVMPDGHPLAGRITGALEPDLIQRNVDAFREDILHEVIPLVEKEYRTSKARANRAVAGLSMGGGQSIDLGLNHPELFGYVAGFSSYVVNAEKARFAVFERDKPRPILLWTACGKDDRLLENAGRLAANLKTNGIPHDVLVTDGNHSWPVWRKHLAQLAPLLFKE